jgi:hypothetical protein
VKPARVSAGLGRCYLRRGADLPQVGYLVIGQGNRSEEDLRNGEAEPRSLGSRGCFAPWP